LKIKKICVVTFFKLKNPYLKVAIYTQVISTTLKQFSIFPQKKTKTGFSKK